MCAAVRQRDKVVDFVAVQFALTVVASAALPPQLRDNILRRHSAARFTQFPIGPCRLMVFRMAPPPLAHERIVRLSVVIPPRLRSRRASFSVARVPAAIGCAVNFRPRFTPSACGCFGLLGVCFSPFR